ncbi:MAG: hypothetical protein HRU38_25815 [Saccharospirillaceae bacterium]|nr:hypothetical protein [Saccharospirillaceae bacterium]
MERYLQPVDDILTYVFIPTLFGSPVNETERRILSLPTKLGGLGIPILRELAPIEYNASKSITKPLVEIIKSQNIHEQPKTTSHIKSLIIQEKHTKYKETFNELKNMVSLKTKRSLELASEKGASNWLTCLPLEQHGFTLNKNEFRDALNIRYHRELKGLPTVCSCGKKFSITHAFNCKSGGFIHIRHDSVRDFNAQLLKKVVNDVEIEPGLQPLDTVVDGGSNSNANIGVTENIQTQDCSRLDIRARGFWRPTQSAFFDVRITNPVAESQINTPIENVYRRHEMEKKRKYNRRIINIENGSFTPLVYSMMGGMGKECSLFHKTLAQKMSLKTGERYDNIAAWVRCKLSFLLLKCSIMCIRGTRILNNKNKMTDCFIPDNFRFACVDTGLET